MPRGVTDGNRDGNVHSQRQARVATDGQILHLLTPGPLTGLQPTAIGIPHAFEIPQSLTTVSGPVTSP